jgi:hypothetical protein
VKESLGPKTEVDPERPFMDNVTAVGVTSVAPEVVRLDETALVAGYGFGANQLQGTAASRSGCYTKRGGCTCSWPSPNHRLRPTASC